MADDIPGKERTDAVSDAMDVATAAPVPSTPRNDRSTWLRRTLNLSQREGAASATMTATSDNFINAFAIYLQASAVQMGWLTAIPQIFGAMFQILSAWLGNYLPRKPMVVVTAGIQAVVVLLLATLAVTRPEGAVRWLIVLAVLYFSCLNFIQPQWRAWMGSIVPQRRRGTFFASRTRLTMAASLLVFVSGGVLLTYSERLGVAWAGFAILFGTAAVGRALSSRYLFLMHDPDPMPHRDKRKGFWQSIKQLREALRDKTFRDYSFFVAGMQGVVAISAPFFALYMLRDLQFTYLEYSLNAIASIVTQFMTLSFWGRFTDRFGNRIVMRFCCLTIPVIPVLWMISPDFYYLLVVQMVSGLVWSGFSLSTANYLYDIRPHKSDFAVYAATQSALGASMVFVGAILGGYIAAGSDHLVASREWMSGIGSGLFIVFSVSTLLRMVVAAWFWRRAVEPRVRKRPKFLQIIFRVQRFNAITGVSLDWLSVTRRKSGKAKKSDRRTEVDDDTDDGPRQKSPPDENPD
jgi:MFS family permease